MTAQPPERKLADVGDVVTRSARVAAKCAAPDVGFLFDFRGPSFESVEAGERLPSIVDALLQGAVARQRSGYVFFSVDVLPHQKRTATVTMHLTCTLNRREGPHPLLLAEKVTGPSPFPADLVADIRDRCRALSGDLAIGIIEGEGSVIRADVLLPCPARTKDITKAPSHAHVTWLIGNPPVAFDSIDHRLHRLGWTTKLFASVIEAQGAAHKEGVRHPKVVIAHERYGVSLSQLEELAHDLPDSVELFLGRVRPSPVAASKSGRVTLAEFPFSPHELFRMTEMLAFDRGEAAIPYSSKAVAPLGRPSALLADDNLVNQLLATEILNMLGFDVELANNGKEAVAHCLEQTPDVILMDIDMPVMDGLQATRALRSLQREGRLPKIPILAVTARTEQSDRSAALEAGIDSYVEKPIDIAHLQRELCRLLPATSDRPPLAGGHP